MNGQNYSKYNWQLVLSAIALFTGAVCIWESPAEAMPEVTPDSFKLAQVGVSSQINSPTPLNLRPRTHIPLPTNSRSSDYDHYSRSDEYSSYDEYGYPHEHHHHRGNQRTDTVIIINPANSNSTSYESYSNRDGYIRIIRQEAN
jgi:hypothetical protein